MNILFWLEPHFELSHPGIMRTWLSWFERLASALTGVEATADFRIVCLDSAAAKERAGILNHRLVLISQADLRANWALSGEAFTLLENDRASPEIIEALAATLRLRLAGFEPGYVFMLNQQPWLRRLFLDAAFINIELSWISRAPFPVSWQLDVAGAGKGRILAEFSETLLADITLDEEANRLIDDVCRITCKHLLIPAMEDFLRPLRARYRQLTLLPLGIFDYLDGQTSFFMMLDKFLGEQDGETVFILTQHPMVKILSDDEIGYLTSRYSHIVNAGEMSSQYLLPLVDQVIGDFGTIAIQSLFFETRVISIWRDILIGDIKTPLRNPLVDLLLTADAMTRRKALYWLLTRYAIPEPRLFDGQWLRRFLQNARRAVKEGHSWECYAETVMSAVDWASDTWRNLPALPEIGIPKLQSDIFNAAGQIFSGVDRLLNQGKPVEAVNALVKFTEAVHNLHERSLQKQIWMQMNNRMFSEAEPASDTLLRLSAKAEHYWQRSHLMDRMGNKEAAITLAHIAVLRAPDTARFQCHWGSLLLSNGNLEAAEKPIREACLLDPLNGAAQHGLGRLRIKQQRYDEAVIALKKAVELVPDNRQFAADLERVNQILK
jgi:tetratricopeptide (TPR) repeat protein